MEHQTQLAGAVHFARLHPVRLGTKRNRNKEKCGGYSPGKLRKVPQLVSRCNRLSLELELERLSVLNSDPFVVLQLPSAYLTLSITYYYTPSLSMQCQYSFSNPHPDDKFLFERDPKGGITERAKQAQ